MGDSQDTNKKSSYEAWTKEESDLLLSLMAEGAIKGWRDNSGIFSKQTVEEKILLVLNERLRCNRTYVHYQSRLKWYKQHWQSYSNIKKFSSGFGYDSTTKRFTAPDEVWDAYLAAHPKDKKLRNGDGPDYNDLELAIGNGVAIGKHSIGLGSGTTDARTSVEDVENEEANRETRIEDLNYDVEAEMFVGLSQDDPMSFPDVSDAPTQKISQSKKRSRSQYEGNSSSSDINHHKDFVDSVKKITSTFERVQSILEKRENEKSITAWDAIKEVPNLDDDIRLKALDLLNTRSIRDSFFKMTIEERAKWINYKIGPL